MNSSIKLDVGEFNAALKQFAVNSSRLLPEIINAQLFYVLARAFLILRPANPQAERAKIRSYMREPIGDINAISKKTGKRIGKHRLGRRVHLITQAKNANAGKAGLYGEAMKKASAKVLRRAVGSVGYLAAPVAKAIKGLQGHFSQFGGSVGPVGAVRIYKGNAALRKLADEYGITNYANVALHKAAKAKVTKAVMSLRPVATAEMTLGIADDQLDRVSSRCRSAFARAYADERREMERHVAEKMQELANKHNVRKV